MKYAILIVMALMASFVQASDYSRYNTGEAVFGAILKDSVSYGDSEQIAHVGFRYKNGYGAFEVDPNDNRTYILAYTNQFSYGALGLGGSLGMTYTECQDTGIYGYDYYPDCEAFSLYMVPHVSMNTGRVTFRVAPRRGGVMITMGVGL